MAETEGQDENQDEDEDSLETAAPQEEPQEDEEVGAESPIASQSPKEAALVPSAAPTTPAGREVAQSGERSAEPVRQILPLGSGLVLIGLGLGLAFVGLRVRRG